MLNISEKKRSRNLFLIYAYQLCDGNAKRDIRTKSLTDKMGIDYEKEGSEIASYWRERECIEWLSFETLWLNRSGIDEAEKIMEKNYADAEKLVLEKVYEMCQQSFNEHIHYNDLPKDIDVKPYNLNDIVEELHIKKFLDSKYDELYKVSVKGIEFLQGRSNQSNQSARDTYNTNNYGNSNNQIGGQNNTQNNQININPEFDNAIKGLIDLVNNANQ